MGDVNRHSAEDPSRQLSGGRLIGFSCLVCGHLLRAGSHRSSAVPMCAGSKARTGKQHELARMEPLVLDCDDSGPPQTATWAGTPRWT